MSRKLILNSLSGTILYAINIIVAFIMSPVLIRVLGNRDYGLWELVMSVIGYMGLLDMGISPALIRFVSVADGKQDLNDLQQTISSAFVFLMGVGSIAMLVFFSLGYSPQIIAGGETKDIANLGTVFFLLGFNAVMLFPMQVFIATLMGIQRHYFINCTRGILAIVRALLTFYLFQRFPAKGLIVIALLEPVFNAVQFVFFAGAIYFDKNVPKMKMTAVTWPKLKELFTFGTKSVIMSVASRFQKQSVPIIIGQVIGLGHIVYFVMPNRLIDYAKDISQVIGIPLAPYYGVTIGRGDHKELLRSWLNTTLALQIVSLAMPLIIFFYGETFLGLWIGHEYAVAGRWVLYILSVGLVADSLASNSFRILTSQSQHGRCAVIWLLLSVLSIPIGIWGASMWGVSGVTLGTTFVVVAGNLVTIYLTCTVMHISPATYFRETVLTLAMPLLLLAILLLTVSILTPAKSYFALIVQIFIAGSVYCLAVWRFTLPIELRRYLSNKLIQLFKAQ